MNPILTFLYRIYQLFIGAPLAAFNSFCAGMSTIIGCTLFDSKFWAYFPGILWSRIMCALFFIPVEVIGREKLDPKKSYVFVANHQSSMDIFLVYGFLGHRFKWMLKKALRKMFFIGFCCEKAGFIFVDKSSMRGIKATIDQARDTLQHGMSLMVFPEGTRTYTGKMKPFNKGAFMLADELQLPVVPITIDGSYEVLPRTRGMIGWVTYHRMRLIIHDAIPPQGQGADNMKALSKMSYDIINADLPEKHQTKPTEE